MWGNAGQFFQMQCPDFCISYLSNIDPTPSYYPFMIHKPFMIALASTPHACMHTEWIH